MAFRKASAPTRGEIEKSEAALARRQVALDDLTRVIEAEIRKAMFDVEAFAAQVAVNERNLQVSRETLDLTRQRFEAGVSGNIEVVQAQDSVSAAAFDYINSVFSHNLAKLNLARSLGGHGGPNSRLPSPIGARRVRHAYCCRSRPTSVWAR